MATTSWYPPMRIDLDVGEGGASISSILAMLCDNFEDKICTEEALASAQEHSECA